MLEEYVKDNYYARFHDPRYRERHFRILLDIKSDKVNGAWNVCQGYWVMVPACNVCQIQLLCKVS